MIPDINSIRELITRAIAVGSSQVLKEIRPTADRLTYNKAGVLYTEPTINKLLQLGLITKYKVGAREFLSRAAIDKVLCESSTQLLFIKMHHEENRNESTSIERGMDRVLEDSKKTRKRRLPILKDLHRSV